ncbi:MAG: hypothetical protein PHH84_04910 [Oscillospiraceae bacterium]|nr:hypothetical protein [Oscillospiraceae bacterium]MDD4414597.1 hypothetical protein [Oscillospiraceae bacterium]
MICPQCGKKSDARVCQVCGHLTEETMPFYDNSEKIPYTGRLKAVIIITVVIVIIAAGLVLGAHIFGAHV